MKYPLIVAWKLEEAQKQELRRQGQMVWNALAEMLEEERAAA